MRERGFWGWHILAGVVILPLLALHMGVMHLDHTLKIMNPAGGHPVDWANVVARGRSGFLLVTYPLLLIAALYHGFYGLRTMLYELRPPSWLKTLITAVLVIGGVALGVYGTWAAIQAHDVAATAVTRVLP